MKCREEIKLLKEQNNALVEKLKEISHELDGKISSTKQKLTSTISPDERLIQELECNKKLIKVYETETRNLNKLLNAKTGYEKVREYETKLSQSEAKYEEFVKTKKALDAEVKNLAKFLSQHTPQEVKAAIQTEVIHINTLIIGR